MDEPEGAEPEDGGEEGDGEGDDDDDELSPEDEPEDDDVSPVDVEAPSLEDDSDDALAGLFAPGRLSVL